MKQEIEISDRAETMACARQVQILVNLIQPDRDYQSFLLIDEASAFELSREVPEVIEEQLEYYPG